MRKRGVPTLIELGKQSGLSMTLLYRMVTDGVATAKTMRTIIETLHLTYDEAGSIFFGDISRSGAPYESRASRASQSQPIAGGTTSASMPNAPVAQRLLALKPGETPPTGALPAQLYIQDYTPVGTLPVQIYP